MSPDAARDRLLILSFSKLVKDPRILRQIDLLAGDYDVITCGYGPAPAGVIDHIEVDERLAAWRPNKFLAASLLLLRRHQRLYFGSARMRLVRGQVALREPVDIVLANDALGVPVGVSLAPRKGVHADLHEYAPRQGEKWWWKLLVAPLMDWSCRRYVPQVASVTTVARGIADEYAREYGFHPEVVPNATPYRPEMTPSAPADHVRIVHMGLASPSRGVDVMVDAVKLANERHPGRFTLDLILVPSVASYHRMLVERAGDASVTGVRVLPPVEFGRIVPTLNQYDLGMHILPPVSFNNYWALPNKFFEFVQARLGVVIGPSPEMARLVRENDLGVVASGFGAADVAAALEAVTPEDVARYKAAAAAVAESFDGRRLSEPWVKAIGRLAGGTSATSRS
ncbi:glycosyltransferase family 1 protein [Georgenia sp. SYP-B2076]|uniref:glycosyltransferase family 1 protein n=1 Tax=Georgenia sp. SYP-B2076 TaxID=2495881 RepID=UPI000F8C46A9|nr:glycosyltransferase family 1 protein [Georgenia sp. SYP-B2076]